MTDDLVAFLRARYDEDEQTARAATSHTGRWRWDHGFGQMCNDPNCPYGELIEEPASDDNHDGTILMQVHGYDTNEPWQGAAHIARHDPARVLREVEAKRRILTKHNVPAVVLPGFGSRDDDRRCVGCGFGSDEEPRVEDVNECPTLRALAAVYADHPDYREEWRP